jgi:hypothetical protein
MGPRPHVHDGPCPVTVEGMENVLRPLIVVGGSLVLTLLVGWIADLLLQACRPTPPGSPPVGPAAPLPPATAGGDVHGAAERVVRPGRDRRRPLRRDRPDPDTGPHRLHGLARGPYRDGDRRLLVLPLRQRPPRSGPGPPSPYAGDADPAGGVGDRRCGRGRRDAADVPRDARGRRLAARLGRHPRHRRRCRRAVHAQQHVRRAADRLRRHGAHRRHGRGGRRVGHGRRDHPDLPDRPHLGRAPDHDAGLVLHVPSRSRTGPAAACR